MKTAIFVVVLAACAFSSRFGISQAAETNVFQWTARPQLTPRQQRMLQLQSSLDLPGEDSPLRTARKTELAALQKELGPLAVRHARPHELISSPGAATNLCTIFNPTKEGLVLTVSVVGDTEQMGTRRASMGRETYLPPGSTVIESNLYWTTPATKTMK